ncbi:MAG: hypothetical protein H5U25_10530 [Oceanibaculum nanhaiense]|nr:hypothetical protein [Oceanibaculum nanhaiense]
MTLVSPITVSDLTATGGVGQVLLAWSNGPDQCLSYRRRAAVEIWAAASNNRAGAAKVGESASNLFVHNASRATRYYWARVRDASGYFGPWFPVSDTAGVSGIAAQAATGDIGSGAVGETNLAANSVSTAKMQAGSVTADRMSVSQLSAITADLGTVNAGIVNGVEVNGATINGGWIQGTTQIQIVNNLSTPLVLANQSGAGTGVLGIATNNGVGVEGATSGGLNSVGVLAEATANNGLPMQVISTSGRTTPEVVQIHAQSTSYASTMLNVLCARSATSSFQFAAFRSSGSGDTEFRLDGDGNAYADGAWTGGGADFAHWLESLDGQPIPVGVTVVFEGERVRPSTAEDDPRAIIGVVRPPEACTVIGNAGWNHWQGKYLRDEAGGYILEDYTVYRWPVQVQDRVLYRWKRKGVERETMDPAAAPKNARKVITMKTEWRESENAAEAPEGAEAVPSRRRKLNPAFDPSVPYSARADRPEWCAVGHAGIVAALKGQPVNPAWRLMAEAGPTMNRWWI